MSSLPKDSKDRKQIPITSGVLDYFPDAIAEVARVSYVGNEQHNPGEPLHWVREKSTDHADCITRHLLERGTLDTDGMRHSAKMAWRALALLQTEIEKDRAETVVSPFTGKSYEMEETSPVNTKPIVPRSIYQGFGCMDLSDVSPLPTPRAKRTPRVYEPEEDEEYPIAAVEKMYRAGSGIVKGSQHSRDCGQKEHQRAEGIDTLPEAQDITPAPPTLLGRSERPTEAPRTPWLRRKMVSPWGWEHDETPSCAESRFGCKRV
jgi:hypothetical protein